MPTTFEVALFIVAPVWALPLLLVPGMDPFKLLSRSTNLSKRSQQEVLPSRPSSGQNAQHDNESKKRKRGLDGPLSTRNDAPNLGIADCSRIFKHHKVKITRLDTSVHLNEDELKGKHKLKTSKKAGTALHPQPLQSFDELTSCYNVSRGIASNVVVQGFKAPTEVQLGALPLLLGNATVYSPDPDTARDDGMDLLTVAPTGSGKTLAFMLPLLHGLQRQRKHVRDAQRITSALILAPTKELTGQIVNEGRKLAQGTGVSISQLRKGMSLAAEDRMPRENDSDTLPSNRSATVVKSDIMVSTPGQLYSILQHSQHALSKIRHLVLDEADVLLDPLFRNQTLEIWNNLSNVSLRVSLWSATMGSNIEELARSTIDKRRQRLRAESGPNVPEAPLIRLVVGLKNSAVPNVQHKLIYAATEQGKLMGLRQLLHPTASSADTGLQLRPPFLVFTQTVERAIALHSELLYDIPPEAGGISRIAVLHANLSDKARASVMIRFRKGEVWVLITTDLLSRGMDFRGINGIVNYDIPTSSAAYVHRVGRTGRAGREGGVAVTLYSKEDVPYLKHVANVVSVAQKQAGDKSVTQQWLLDALPTLSKSEKQNLKRRGIESRTARADPEAARKARISSKAGFVRRVENKRKGAVLGSQRRAQAEVEGDEGDETDFGGFD